jgi:hypothetical protein
MTRDRNTTMRWQPWAALMGWAMVAGYCVWGFAPAVDLAGHGAQMQAMADWLRDVPAIRERYDLRFHVGYGLPLWLFLPVAAMSSGAVAARLALWVCLMLYPLSGWALARAFGRTPWVIAVLTVPFAFNLSYWYGLVPGLFAQPLVFLAVASFGWGLKNGQRRWLGVTALLAVATALSHLLTFGALAAALLALAHGSANRLKSTLQAVACVLLAGLVGLAEVARLLSRSVHPEGSPPTEWSLDGHSAWFFRVYGPEGLLSVALPVAITVVAVVLWVHQRRPAAPVAAFVALGVCFLVMPKTAGGIYLACSRLPPLAGVLALTLPVWPVWRGTKWLLVLAGLSLTETVVFHARFAHAVSGLDQLIAQPPAAPPAVHGYLPVAGTRVLGSKHIYAEHLGQWWTASHGGLGHHFFADADHHPIHFRPGHELPMSLFDAPDQAAQFDQLLVFGPGEVLGFREVTRKDAWRLMQRLAR